MQKFLDFEKDIADLEARIADLKAAAEAAGDNGNAVSVGEEITGLEQKVDRLLRQTYAKLTPWQKTQVARHADRPRFGGIVGALIEGFTPLAGDRQFADDQAIQGGLGRFRGRAVMVIGHEKGQTTESRLKHNFGMARPEGYRKAVRLMRLADRFGLPVLTFVDTPGAFPGIDAEARGQAEAIARSTEACLDLGVPLIATVVGEGGSGGAIALAAANKVLMLEHAVYSVISPEACSSILYRTETRAQDAAEALRLTAQDLHQLKVIDEVIEEPVGGAHRAPAAAIAAIGEHVARSLDELDGQTRASLKARRRHKFLDMGRVGLA
ncbi:MAG: acetyl-CoA carboxylase carboxyltransferase subunit alpha [Alphaproteobacteria bacterium]|nr:acetyl-CoA carboxylase carboxyltransferase subunit alpha [Alphaproteobacteria bacterium]